MQSLKKIHAWAQMKVPLYMTLSFVMDKFKSQNDLNLIFYVCIGLLFFDVVHVLEYSSTCPLVVL